MLPQEAAAEENKNGEMPEKPMHYGEEEQKESSEGVEIEAGHSLQDEQALERSRLMRDLSNEIFPRVIQCVLYYTNIENAEV